MWSAGDNACSACSAKPCIYIVTSARERERDGGREGGREGEKERGREREREGEREGERERRREGGRESAKKELRTCQKWSPMLTTSLPFLPPLPRVTTYACMLSNLSS